MEWVVWILPTYSISPSFLLVSQKKKKSASTLLANAIQRKACIYLPNLTLLHSTSTPLPPPPHSTPPPTPLPPHPTPTTVQMLVLSTNLSTYMSHFITLHVKKMVRVYTTRAQSTIPVRWPPWFPCIPEQVISEIFWYSVVLQQPRLLRVLEKNQQRSTQTHWG